MEQDLHFKIRSVEKLFGKLDRHTSAFKRRSGIRCVPECGECCLKEDLEANVLEFLPAANRICQQGKSDRILGRIDDKEDSVCVFYNPFGKEGKCSVYEERGLICRLFGFSARTDKLGERSMVTCSIIKQGQQYRQAGTLLKYAPNLSSYYLRIHGIDPSLSVKYMPVNHAIREAIEMVEFRSNFRKRPA